MAKTATKVDFELDVVGTRSRRDYPWDEWMNGKTWVAEQGEDFDDAKGFRSTLNTAAKREDRTLAVKDLGPDGKPVGRKRKGEDRVVTAVAFKFGPKGSAA